MPLAAPTSPALLAQARMAAKSAVYAKYKAIALGPPQRPLTSTEQGAMQTEIEVADAAAILAFIVTNAVVITPTGGGTVT